ncbi:acid protease [Acephala macrosclerotiorum]|nr:acid protease [Acephala macrosclerotiorum]
MSKEDPHPSETSQKLSSTICYSNFTAFAMRVHILFLLTSMVALATTSPSFRQARSETTSSASVILTVDGQSTDVLALELSIKCLKDCVTIIADGICIAEAILIDQAASVPGVLTCVKNDVAGVRDLFHIFSLSRTLWVHQGVGNEWKTMKPRNQRTPPRPFRAIIDLTWSDPFVSSASCDGEHCKAFSQRYNSRSSSTYECNGIEITLMYGLIEGFGIVSNNKFSLGMNLTVSHLDFIELKGYHVPNHIGEVRSFDSILGLAIEGQGYMFGGYNKHLFERDLVSHLLFLEDTTKWTVRVDGLYVKRHDCSGATKRIDTLGHGPALNWTALFSNNMSYIGIPCGGIVVECDSISELSDLIIDFGGQNITITGEDYVERIIPTDPDCQNIREECTIIVTGLPYFMDGVTPELIVFGMAFLNKVYGVFDWDKRPISFGGLRE